MLTARQLYFEAVKVGDELPPLVKPPVDRLQIARYAGAAQDWNPLSVDEQHARNAGAQARPTFLFERELLATRPGDAVELGFAVLLGGSPLGAEPSVLLHAVERGVERSFLHAQEVGRHTLDVGRDRVAVHRASRLERLEHEERQGALQDVVLGARHIPN